MHRKLDEPLLISVISPIKGVLDKALQRRLCLGQNLRSEMVCAKRQKEIGTNACADSSNNSESYITSRTIQDACRQLSFALMHVDNFAFLGVGVKLSATRNALE